MTSANPAIPAIPANRGLFCPAMERPGGTFGARRSRRGDTLSQGIARAYLLGLTRIRLNLNGAHVKRAPTRSPAIRCADTRGRFVTDFRSSDADGSELR